MKVSFRHFIEYFPEIELPISLGENAHHAFSQQNEPLPKQVVEEFIQPLEDRSIDEFTEFVPCLRIPIEKEDFIAIIYWRADLLNYEYTLATFLKNGDLINKRVIAGVASDGQYITQSIANIEENWLINIATGRSKANDEIGFDAKASKIHELELLTDGSIINAI